MHRLIVAYAETCHGHLSGFVSAAYFWKYGKPIPGAALKSDYSSLLKGGDESVPLYLIEFFFQGRERWRLVHEKGCHAALKVDS